MERSTTTRTTAAMTAATTEVTLHSTTTVSAHNNYTNAPLPLDVDWNAVACTSDYGQASLLSYMSFRDLDQLIGWATHFVTHDKLHDIKKENDNNPLVGLPPSCIPPSVLNMLLLLAQQSSNSADTTTLDSTWEASVNMNLSAHVAVGHVLEESLAATLLPLAALHVERCSRRQAQQQQEHQQIKATDDIADAAAADKNDDSSAASGSPTMVQSFVSPTATTTSSISNSLMDDDWTLPPEEAIFRLLTDRDYPYDDRVMGALQQWHDAATIQESFRRNGMD